MKVVGNTLMYSGTLLPIGHFFLYIYTNFSNITERLCVDVDFLFTIPPLL